MVLSGEREALAQTEKALKEKYGEGVRTVLLNVSAPFHSRFMKAIEENFYDFLKEYRDSFAPKFLPKVLSNVTGDFYQADSSEAISLLARQLSHGVKWRDNMDALCAKTQSILELGPNRPLRGFFNSINVSIQSVINVKSAEKVFA